MDNKSNAKNQKRAHSPAYVKSNKRLTMTKINQKEVPADNQASSQYSNEGKEAKIQKGSCFKNPKYRETGYAKRIKVWKNLKQIMALQKSQSSQETVLYASIDAPPSKIPVKKYSDISGFPALYSDPVTKLRYSNSDEYRRIGHLSSDTVMGLLALRRAPY